MTPRDSTMQNTAVRNADQTEIADRLANAREISITGGQLSYIIKFENATDDYINSLKFPNGAIIEYDRGESDTPDPAYFDVSNPVTLRYFLATAQLPLNTELKVIEPLPTESQGPMYRDAS
jgi:hypothetical protein